MNTEYVKLTEAARKLSMHTDTLRYWVKILGIETIKQGRARYLMVEKLSVLTIMANLVADGLSAGEAATKAKAQAPIEVANIIVPKANQVPAEMDELKVRFKSLEQVILTMADAFKTEVSELRGEISKLTESNQKLQKQLEKPPLLIEFLSPPKPIKPWEPSAKIKSSLDNMSWFKKVWIEFFEPWKMRQETM